MAWSKNFYIVADITCKKGFFVPIFAICANYFFDEKNRSLAKLKNPYVYCATYEDDYYDEDDYYYEKKKQFPDDDVQSRYAFPHLRHLKVT